MTLRRVITVALTALSLAACTATPGSAPTTPATSGAASSPSAAAQAYRYADLDLCAVTDLAPLADLKLTVQSKRRTLPMGRKQGEAESCLHEMKTQGGQIARLTIEAILGKSVDDARTIYRGGEQDSMKPDAAISGLGEQAEGRWLDSEVGYKHSEYLVHMRSGNLHLSVWLAVGGTSFTPKETLAPKVKALTEATFTKVSQAWQ